MGILFAKEIQFVKKGELIKAIKAYRARTGSTLKEAKEAVDAFRARNGLDSFEPTVTMSKQTRKKLEALITEWRDAAARGTEDYEIFGDKRSYEKSVVFNRCAAELEDAIK